MECRRIQITLISASDLEDVRTILRMKVYAVVSIAGNKETERQSTPVDYENKTNPAWNCTIKYTIGEQALYQEGVMLVVKLYCKRTAKVDKYIGEVRTSIKELYDHWQANRGRGGGRLTKRVQRDSAVSQGELSLSCMFSEKEIFKEEEKEIVKEEAPGKKWPKKGKVIFLRAVASLCIPLVLGCDDDDDD